MRGHTYEFDAPQYFDFENRGNTQDNTEWFNRRNSYGGVHDSREESQVIDEPVQVTLSSKSAPSSPTFARFKSPGTALVALSSMVLGSRDLDSSSEQNSMRDEEPSIVRQLPMTMVDREGSVRRPIAQNNTTVSRPMTSIPTSSSRGAVVSNKEQDAEAKYLARMKASRVEVKKSVTGIQAAASKYTTSGDPVVLRSGRGARENVARTTAIRQQQRTTTTTSHQSVRSVAPQPIKTGPTKIHVTVPMSNVPRFMQPTVAAKSRVAKEGENKQQQQQQRKPVVEQRKPTTYRAPVVQQPVKKTVAAPPAHTATQKRSMYNAPTAAANARRNVENAPQPARVKPAVVQQQQQQHRVAASTQVGVTIPETPNWMKGSKQRPKKTVLSTEEMEMQALEEHRRKLKEQQRASKERLANMQSNAMYESRYLRTASNFTPDGKRALNKTTAQQPNRGLTQPQPFQFRTDVRGTIKK